MVGFSTGKQFQESTDEKRSCAESDLYYRKIYADEPLLNCESESSVHTECLTSDCDEDGLKADDDSNYNQEDRIFRNSMEDIDLHKWN